MPDPKKKTNFVEFFIMTLVVAGLPLGIVWLIFDWDWFYFVVVNAIIALYIMANKDSL